MYTDDIRLLSFNDGELGPEVSFRSVGRTPQRLQRLLQH